MSSAWITNTAAFLPNAPVENDAMEQVLGLVGERPSRARRLILKSNGIKARHYAIDPETRRPTHSNTELTAQAIAGLSDRVDIQTLDCLVCGTSVPDQLMPNHALMVQGALGLPPLEAVATSGICLSGLTALNYARYAVASGDRQLAVATGSELASPHLLGNRFGGVSEAALAQLERAPELAFDQEFLRWMLSDGAGACLIEPEPRPDGLSLRIDWLELFAFAGELPPCMYAGAVRNADGGLTGWATLDAEERQRQNVMAIKQDVRLLNEAIVPMMIDRPLPGLIEKRGLRADAIDHFLPHYSSNYFRDPMRAGLARAGLPIPPERWFSNLATKGNTGAASIYIMLDELYRSGRLRAGETILCFVPESGRFSCGYMHLTVAG